MVLYDGYRGRKIGMELWQDHDGDWRRQQKYIIRSANDWAQDKEVIEEIVKAI